MATKRKKDKKKSKLKMIPKSKNISKMSEAQKKKITEDPVDRIGNEIDKNWKQTVKENWPGIKESIKDIPAGEEGESVYLYVTVDKKTRDVECDDVSTSGYWQGASQSRFWVAPIPVDKETTKQDLLDVDLSEECHYYDDLDFLGEE